MELIYSLYFSIILRCCTANTVVLASSIDLAMLGIVLFINMSCCACRSTSSVLG